LRENNLKKLAFYLLHCKKEVILQHLYEKKLKYLLFYLYRYKKCVKTQGTNERKFEKFLTAAEKIPL